MDKYYFSKLIKRALLSKTMMDFLGGVNCMLILRDCEGQQQVRTNIDQKPFHDPKHIVEAINVFFEYKLCLLEIVRQ